MSDFAIAAEKKIAKLYSYIFAEKNIDSLANEISPELAKTGGRKLFTVFFSVTDSEERAHVFRCSAEALSDAWEGAKKIALKFINTNSYNCCWIKADIMKSSRKVPLDDVIKEVRGNYNEFFRKGLAFDEELQTAVLEAEINCNKIISYKKQTIELAAVNKYLSPNCKKTLLSLPSELIVFECLSFFSDEEDRLFTLYSGGNNCGRRIIPYVTKDIALEVITSSSDYLAMQIYPDGKFDYGFYPVYHKLIPGYNALRHASSIWSLICAYKLTGDKYTLGQAENAITYMINNMVYRYKKPSTEENTAYYPDRNANEIKLGGNAVAVILLTEYMKQTGSDKYKKLCKELGNGILELFNTANGEFYHVLNYPGFTPKEKFRTVYYDGEAAFALCRLYSLTKEKRWLNAAKLAADRFIAEDYTRYRDHWIAYAMNELTMHLPEEKYFEFALRNAQRNLRRIHDQPTTYHTYLELLTVTFETYKRIIDGGHKVKYLEKFDLGFFVETIFHRAHYMLNGYGYPEYVMYLKFPCAIVGSFFVRHDGFRIRIDDIQHFCGAYYSFYKHYDELMELRDKLNINIDESR